LTRGYRVKPEPLVIAVIITIGVFVLVAKTIVYFLGNFAGGWTGLIWLLVSAFLAAGVLKALSWVGVPVDFLVKETKPATKSSRGGTRA
jgi:hypothetical protein